MKAKVLVVDDSPTMQAIISQSLGSDPAIEVVGTANSANDAREKIKRLNPDVITLDIEMPGMNGLDFLDRIMKLRPMPVIVVSSHTVNGAEITLSALERGAFECYAKPKELASAVSGKHGDRLRRLVKHAFKSNGLDGRSKNANRAQPEESEPSKCEQTDIDLIAIGSSTGGVEALFQILSNWPADCKPTLIVQHIFGSFGSALAKRLNRVCPANVLEAETDTYLRDGHVYLATAKHRHLVVRNRSRLTSRLVVSPENSNHRPSVDVMFEAIAKEMDGRALGIILTGMGGDGANGLLAMRKAGCPTIGQSEQSCVVYGMPKRAAQLGALREVADLNAIAGRVAEIC